jgi:hypothetical protein
LPPKDLERAKGWYRGKLGLTPTSAQPGLISYESGGVIFVLYTTMQQIPASTLVAMQWPVPAIRATVQEFGDRGLRALGVPPGVEWDGEAPIIGEALRAWFRDSEATALP